MLRKLAKGGKKGNEPFVQQGEPDEERSKQYGAGDSLSSQGSRGGKKVSSSGNVSPQAPRGCKKVGGKKVSTDGGSG